MDGSVSSAPVSHETIYSGRSENLSGCCADERRSKFKRQSILDQRHAIKIFESKGFTLDHVNEIWIQIIKNKCDLNSINTSDEMKTVLQEDFALNTIRLVSQVVSDDLSIRRLMLELQDGHTIEAVIMKYGFLHNNNNKTAVYRPTLCVSCQVGNNMDCTFCAKGNDGLFANLTSGEILEQLQIANTFEKITNVAFMGMGEPLDNYKEVIAAAKAMVDPNQFGLEPKNITISTVGIPERINTLAADLPGVSLSLSLHSANQDIRENLIPSARMFPLTEIFQSLDTYLNSHSKLIKDGTGERVLIEYVLIYGINDSQKDATDLANSILPRKDFCAINPSLFNPPTVFSSKFKSPSLDSLKEFVAVVQSRGLSIVPRYADFNNFPEPPDPAKLAEKSTKPADLPKGNASKCSQMAVPGSAGEAAEPVSPPEKVVPLMPSAPSFSPPAKAVSSKPATPPLSATESEKPPQPQSLKGAPFVTPRTTDNPLETFSAARSDLPLLEKFKAFTFDDWKEYFIKLKMNACPRNFAKEVYKQTEGYYEKLKGEVQFVKDVDDFWNENVESKYHLREEYGFGPVQCAMAASMLIMVTSIGLMAFSRSKRT